jgi:hypothetical protein
LLILGPFIRRWTSEQVPTFKIFFKLHRFSEIALVFLFYYRVIQKEEITSNNKSAYLKTKKTRSSRKVFPKCCSNYHPWFWWVLFVWSRRITTDRVIRWTGFATECPENPEWIIPSLQKFKKRRSRARDDFLEVTFSKFIFNWRRFQFCSNQISIGHCMYNALNVNEWHFRKDS